MCKVKLFTSLGIVIILTMLMSSVALAMDPPDKMWVKTITMSYTGATTHTVKAYLVIWDSDGDGTERAKVTTQWTLPNGTIQNKTGTTKSDGQVSVSIASSLSGDYKICVTNVNRKGYQYDPAQNIITCNTINVP